MTKKEAFDNAKDVWPAHKPTRAAMLTNTDDGEGVMIAGYDQMVTMVLVHKTDLYRLKSVVDSAIQAQESKKSKKALYKGKRSK